jgi:MSHA pilin protein MshC
MPTERSGRFGRGTRALRGTEFRATGFTLIELVTVMTIIGVLGAYLGPKFFTQSVFSQRSYADELAAALRATQKTAVITGCPAELTITSSTYVANQQTVSNNSCNTSDTTWAMPVLGIDGAPIAGSAPSSTTASPTGIYLFDDQGRLTRSPGTTITIGARTISIVAGTGYVQVQ